MTWPVQMAIPPLPERERLIYSGTVGETVAVRLRNSGYESYRVTLTVTHPTEQAYLTAQIAETSAQQIMTVSAYKAADAMKRVVGHREARRSVSLVRAGSPRRLGAVSAARRGRRNGLGAAVPRASRRAADRRTPDARRRKSISSRSPNSDARIATGLDELADYRSPQRADMIVREHVSPQPGRRPYLQRLPRRQRQLRAADPRAVGERPGEVQVQHTAPLGAG